jgi:hypothetical protein
MMDAMTVSETLDALSDADTAKRQSKQVQPLKGVRGTPLSEVARILAAIQLEAPPKLPDDAGELSDLFAAAWEDGLIAVGLLAACVPDAPQTTLDIGLEWVNRIDDTATADALGWLVLGGSCLAAGEPLSSLGRPSHIAARRSVVMAAMAALPEPVEGPAASALRARLSQKRVAWVEAPRSEALHAHLTAWWRDESPAVRKAVRRVLRTWTKSDPAAVVVWGDSIKGGLPKLLRAEVDRARRRANRPTQ